MSLWSAIVWILCARDEVRLEVHGGRFSVGAIHLPAKSPLHLVNRDDLTYTIESPGAFLGDVMLAAHSEVSVKMQRGGSFVAMIEERPDSEVRLNVDADPFAEPSSSPPFDLARQKGLQPLDAEGHDAAYGAVTQFDFAVRGQIARQQVLKDLFRLQEDLSGDQPPTEFLVYFTPPEWATLKGSVAMVTGLGPSAYDRTRFGSAVAATRPAALHSATGSSRLGIPANDSGQRDLLVRVTSDSAWFNMRVCRLIWSRLAGRISRPKLEWGYAGPNGRSPILGGFYDGTGNSSGAERTHAVFDADNYSVLAIYRIRFDEVGFLANSKSVQEATIGRERTSGRPLKRPNGAAHKVRASDGQSNIVRMPLIFDEGVRGTGLLFISIQRTLSPLEKLLNKMADGTHGSKDSLMKFMHFESAANYAVPPLPKGGYPGSLRTGAFTFGS